jgi:hypothetical protein
MAVVPAPSYCWPSAPLPSAAGAPSAARGVSPDILDPAETLGRQDVHGARAHPSSRRQLGVAQPQKTALELDALRSVVLAIPAGICAGCVRALLLVGWAAALRRSELVALQVGDLSFEPEGVVLTIRRSKTDREGAGAIVAARLGGEEATFRSLLCAAGSKRRR